MPMYWSHDEESAEARIEFQKLMGYTFASNEDIETVQSENTYLTTHNNLVQFYAALLVVTTKISNPSKSLFVSRLRLEERSSG